MDGVPKPPDDEELANIIDKLAKFVARNGKEFEAMTKQKQKDNPRFSFLFAGEHFGYYQYRVTTEQAIMRQQEHQPAVVQQIISAQSMQSSSWMQQQQLQQLQEQLQQLQEQLDQKRQSAAEQIKQSETNLAAQYESILQQQQIAIDEAIFTAKKEELKKLCTECEISLDELNSVVDPIIGSCTKDAISNGKNWIFNHNQSQKHADLVANYLLDRVADKDATFECRLHLVYLINDVLHHCVRKSADDLRSLLAAVVVPIVCIAQLGVDESRRSKITKLLSLWETNEYFDTETLRQMNDPMSGMSAYQTTLLNKYSELVQRISQEMNTKYMSLQHQHQEFVNHLQSQVVQLEQQLHQKQQQIASNSGTSSSMGLVDSTPSQMSDRSSHQYDPTVMASSNENGGLMTSSGQMGSIASSEIMGGYTGGGLHHDQVGFQQHYAGGPQQFGGYMQGPQGGPFGGGLPHGDMSMQPHSGPNPLPPSFNLPDFSKPPPGFGPSMGFGPVPPHQGGFPPISGPHSGGHMGGMGMIPPLMSLPPPMDADLMPSMPYYDLPAGLMAPLVKLEDTDYRPLDPKEIRLPPPLPPTERLLAAVEAFYSAPTHERPRDSDGWEKLGLFEFFKAKKKAKQQKVENGRRRGHSRSRSPRKSRHGDRKRRSRSKSPLPYSRSSRSKSRSRTRSRSSSKSRSYSKSSSKSRSSSRSPGRRSTSYNKRKSDKRRRSSSRSRQRSPTRRSSPRRSPPRRSSPRRSPSSRNRSPNRSNSPFMYAAEPYYQVQTEHSRLGEDNKGHMLLTKMGWGGRGLGSTEQGIVDPVAHADIRDRQDQFKGIGIALNDPFEHFRKNKSQGYTKLIKEKAAEKAATSQ